MDAWTNIHYRDFYDVPRMIVATGPDGTFLFWSRFDEKLDEYVDRYEVWRMPKIADDELRGSWIGLEARALERMPNIALSELPFAVERYSASR